MGLRRELGARSAVFVTIGAMIGSGIFATPHDVARSVSTLGLTVGLWVVGGALALLGALSFAELGAAIPETGGLYVYLRRAFGPMLAFCFAWAMMAVLVPSSVGFFAHVTATHIVQIVRLPRSSTPLVAAAVIAVILAFNLRGARQAAGFQDATTWIKTVGIAALSVLAVALHAMGTRHAPMHAAPSSATLPTPTVMALLGALVPVLWAYDGWIDVTSVAGEVREPQRNVPRSLVWGTMVVAAVYVLANVAYFNVLGAAGLAATETPAIEVAARVGGTAAANLVALLVGVSTLGGCAVGLFSGARVVYAVAAAGDFLRPFGRTSERGVPAVALAACSVLAVAYVASPIGRLGEIFVIGAWPFYAAGAIGTIVMRRREPSLARPHRTLAYPFTPVIFAAGSIAIVAGYAAARPRHTAFSLFVIACGIPVYLLTRRPGRGSDVKHSA